MVSIETVFVTFLRLFVAVQLISAAVNVIFVILSQVERYAVDVWNLAVKKQIGRNLTPVANAKCKLNVIMLTLMESSVH